MTAIKPTDSTLRELIDEDGYNIILNGIQEKFTEMDKYIGNLESDVQSIKDFETQLLDDQKRGYDVGSSLETLTFQKESLQIDLEFFVYMKEIYITKLYGDLYKYCDSIIENALNIEELPPNTSRETVKQRKFRSMVPYPPVLIDNVNAFDLEGNPIEGEPLKVPDPFVKYDMNGIFSLINVTMSNLRELSDDIGTFKTKIQSAKDKESRGFAVGNLIMNLEGQEQKLTIEFKSNIERISTFLIQNKNFSMRCLNRIKLISSEITTAEEQKEQQEQQEQQEPQE